MKLNYLLFLSLAWINLFAQKYELSSSIECFDIIFKDKKQNYLVGEHDHENIETQKLKADLLLFSIRKKKVEQLVFEGDLAECYFAGKSLKGDTNNTTINAIFPVWHSKNMKELFKQLSYENFQFIGNDIRPWSKYFQKWLHEKLSKYEFYDLNRFIILDDEIIHWGLKMNKKDSIQTDEHRKLYRNISKSLLENKNSIDSIDYIVAQKGILNRLKLIEFINKENTIDKYKHRDECLAENLIWIDSIFNLKSFIWAHNFHNAYSNFKRDEKNNWKPAGMFLSHKYKANSTNIAISISNKNGTFEYQNKGTKKYCVINLINQKKEVNSLCNIRKDQSILGNQFDMLIIINE